MTDTKLYVPVVTLSTVNDKNFLEQLKSGFKRTVKKNKYGSQMTIQSNSSNLNYLIDPTLTKIDRLFVLSFARNAEGDHREILFHIIMYQTSKYKISLFRLMEKVSLTCQ